MKKIIISMLVLASQNAKDWTPISTNVAFTGKVVVTDSDATNNRRCFYAATVGTQAITILENQSTTDGTRFDIKVGKKGAQSFRHGAAGGSDYTLSKIVLALSRSATLPSTNFL